MTPEDPVAVIARTLTGRRRRGPTAPPSCFVALGDSFTAGTGCPASERWADRLALTLRSISRQLQYRNLAFDGATSADVVGQVGPALELEPDLVTVVCGGNDVLRSPRPDVDAYAGRLRLIFGRLRATLPALTLVTATAPGRWSFVRLGPRTRARVEDAIGRLNEATRTMASAYGALCLDLAEHPGLDDAGNFCADGLHPSRQGHARAAREFARLLRQETGWTPANPHEQGGTP